MPSTLVLSPDDTEWERPTAGPGLLLDVPAEGPWRHRPFLHVQADPPFLRFMAGAQPLLWIHVEDGWETCGFLRGPAWVPGVLPPFTAADVRAIREQPGSPAWWEAWSRSVVRHLEASPASPLHAGRWCLRPLPQVGASRQYSTRPVGPGVPPEPPYLVHGASVLGFEPFWREYWQFDGYSRDSLGEDFPSSPPKHSGQFVWCGGVISLRPPSPEDSGRLKVWRKAARDGSLPPVLLLYLAPLRKWVVLDGHDRLLAASFEQCPVPILGLWRVRETPVPEEALEHARRRAERIVEGRLRGDVAPDVLDDVNRYVLKGYVDIHRSATTQAWPIPGGARAWRSEVLGWCESQRLHPQDWEWERFVARGWW